MIPEDCLYTREHEWLRMAVDEAVVGITDYAAGQLGDVTFVELPEEGLQFSQGQALAVVESVKAISDIYAPVGGQVVEVNEKLADEPGLINESPYGDGWICRIALADASECEGLLNHADYARLLDELK